MNCTPAWINAWFITELQAALGLSAGEYLSIVMEVATACSSTTANYIVDPRRNILVDAP